MIKNIAIALSTSVLVSACIELPEIDSESSESGGSGVSKETSCVKGTYTFKTTKDGKSHFSASFDGAGNIAYNLRDQAKGIYTATGNKVTFTKLTGDHSGTLTWTVTKQSADCRVNQFAGNSQGGQPMTATR